MNDDPDAERLAALRRSGLLDSPAESAFDRLTSLAARVLKAPVALVSLVDANRQFFKSCVGLAEPWAGARETPLTHSFCRHVVAAAGPLVVEDSRVHPLVRDSPAIGDLNVVAYLGVPLRTPAGHVLGSLCVIDGRPRAWSEQDLATLNDLGACVMTEVALRAEAAERSRNSRKLREYEGRFRRIFESAKDFSIFATDRDGTVTDWNAGAENVFGYCGEEIIGRPAAVLFTPEDRADGAPTKELATAAQTGRATDERWHVKKDGNRFFASGMVTPLLDDSGELIGFTKICRDITGRQHSDAEQDRLLGEVRAERERLADVIRRAPSFMAVLKGADHVFELINEKYRQLIGGREVVGKPIREALPEVEGQGYFEMLDGVYRTGETVVGAGSRVLLAGPSGEVIRERFLDFVYQPIRDADGAVTGVFVHGVDLTDRVVAERERERLDARVESDRRLLDAVFEALPVGLVIADPGGRLVRMNRANEELWNNPPPTGSIAEYAPWVGYWADTGRRVEPHEWTLARVLLTGESVAGDQFEIERFHGGGRRHVVISGAPVRDAAGRLAAGVIALVDVTARVAAEAALRASEQKYRTLFDSIDEGFCVIEMLFDDDGRAFDWIYQEMNPAFEKHTGLRDVSGRTTREASPGMDPHWFELYGRVARTGEPVRYVNEARALGGRWFEVYAFRLGGPGSRKVAVLFNNVTEKRRAQVESQMLAAIVASSDDAIISKDLNGVITSWNAAAERIFGYSAGEIVGRPITVLIPEESLDEEVTILGKIRRGERVDHFETRRRTKSGRLIDLAITVSPIRDAEGTVIGASKVARDVTERKEAAEETERLQREKEKQQRIYEAALSNTPDLAYVWGLDHRFIYANEALLAMWGRSREEAIGKHCIELGYEPWHAEMHDREIDQVVATKRPFRGEVPFTGTNGRRIYDYILVPVVGPGGVVEAVAGTTRDVTDRKAAEEATEAARAEAEAANLAKDEFLATLSHELRTPLNAIVGWAKILRGGKVDAEDLAEGLDVIERNGQTQSQLIEDLLDVSRITTGNLRLDVQRLNIADVIEAAIAAVAPAATAKEIRLLKTLDSLVGPVSGDFSRLQQVIWNLLTNAVKFTPKGGRVQLLLERVNSHIEVSVIDSGMGIKPDFLPHVFERFRQADGSTTRRHGGLGLGLSIVKHLVEMHGGSIRAKSPGEGQGSTFTVSLPITVVHPERPASSKARPKDAAHQDEDLCQDGALAGLRLLVVDDEPDARQMLRRVLVGCEAEVVVAGSAAEALELLMRFHPDVIVSDIGMPDQDGYDLIRKVRETASAKQLPAVALTAFARAEDRKRAMLAGFQSHVSKPVDPSELTAVIASLAGRTGGSD